MSTTIHIWYNPDTDTYQKGSFQVFSTVSINSVNRDRFQLLYQFEDIDLVLAEKILKSLNHVRSSFAKKEQFSVA